MRFVNNDKADALFGTGAQDLEERWLCESLWRDEDNAALAGGDPL
jgi:hypothetical protein